MKTKLHTALLYPLVLIFSSFLKGKKTEYNQFFKNRKKIEKKDILQVNSIQNNFYENIKLFFDKKSSLYDKTNVNFELDLNTIPEEKKYFTFDFFRVVNIYYTLSMLSARVTNKNIEVSFTFNRKKFDDSSINNLLRYTLLTFASKKVDTFFLSKENLKDEKSILAYDTMVSYLEDSTIVNFTNAKNLYVLTCTKYKKTFDIIWSSNENIELTEFNKVYDKFGIQLTKDIKISKSPIYALHK